LDDVETRPVEKGNGTSILKMKNILLTLVIFASLTNAKADAFYSGVHVGMPLEDCFSYYFSGDPPIAASYTTWLGHAPPAAKIGGLSYQKARTTWPGNLA
jgi:hypothetical protein